MKDELNMENLKVSVGKYILCFTGTINVVFSKRKVLFFYMEINEPCETNKN